MAGRWRKPLPTKRPHDQSAMTAFLPKKNQRVEDNASKTPTAPRGPKPKNEKIDDEPKPKPAPTATTPNKADGDVEILTVRSPRGTIEIIDSPEPKPKPKPKLLVSAQATSKVVFDMSGVRHGDVVEPKVDKVRVEDPRSFTMSNHEFQLPPGLDLSRFKGNRIYGELPVENPTSAADVRPTLERLKQKYQGRHPCMKGVGGKIGASGAELVDFKRNKSTQVYGMYPHPLYAVDETVLLSYNIGNDSVLREVENLGNENNWWCNENMSNGLNGLLAPNGGRLLLSEEPGGHRGLVYVIFLKPNERLQSLRDVKQAQFDLVQTSLENALYDPTTGRKIHTPRVNYPGLVKLLELSPIPEKQFHVAFTRQGVAYIN